MKARSPAKKAEAPPSKKEPAADGAPALSLDPGSLAKALGGDAFVLDAPGANLSIEVISYQCPTLNRAAGRPGVPVGRLTVLHGKEGSGKTTIGLHVCAEATKNGGVAMYSDNEYKLDPDWAKQIGVDTSRFVMKQPRNLEETIRDCQKFIAWCAERKGKLKGPCVYVLDSIDGAKAKAVVEGEVGKDHMAVEARLWSKHLPGLVDAASRARVALVFVAQTRTKIGVMFGDDETISGGNAIRFYASCIAYVRRVGKVKNAAEVVWANRVQVEFKKNQIGAPFKKAEFMIVFPPAGAGIDRHRGVMDLAETEGLFEIKGSNFYFNGTKVANGREKVADALRADEAMTVAIEKALAEKLGW